MKIGVSDNPYKRLSQLQTGSPYKLELFALLAVNGDSNSLEAILHDALEKYHVRGEWFNLPRSHIKAVFEAEVEYKDSPASHKRLPAYSGVAY